MPERWQQELRKLRNVEPPADLWDRVTPGPHRESLRTSARWRVIGPIAAVLAVVLVIGGLSLARVLSPAGSAASGPSAILPTGVMSAARACRQVVDKHRASRGFFIRIERVHLVLTTYAKGEPVESQGDIATGMLAQTLVWVVEVHARAINWNHSVPASYQPPKLPDTDYSVVMNARTGLITDEGECRCWPLPLSKIGNLVSLPPKC